MSDTGLNDSMSIFDGAVDLDEAPPAPETASEDTSSTEVTETSTDEVEAKGDSAEASGEEAEAAASPQETTEAAAAAAAAAKVLAFKAGDKEFPVDETAVIEWKVDGKPTPVALKDLLQNFSGKVAWEKRFNEVAEQRKAVLEKATATEQRAERHQALVKNMYDSVMSGKVFDAAQAMIEMSGLSDKIDGKTYIQNLRSKLIEQAQALSQMTPEQRQVYEEQEKSAYLQSQYEQLRQQREQEQAQQAFQGRVAKAIEAAGTNTEEFAETRLWLKSAFEQQKRDLSELTPEFIANHIKEVRVYKTASEGLSAVNPELAKDEKHWNHAAQLLKNNPDWTAKEIEEIYREATTTKRAASVSQKVAKTPVRTAATVGASKKQARKDPREDYSNFSDTDLSW